jgi:hypothetical protein
MLAAGAFLVEDLAGAEAVKAEAAGDIMRLAGGH